MKIYIKELDGYKTGSEERLINKYEYTISSCAERCMDVSFENPEFPYVEYNGDQEQIDIIIGCLVKAGFTVNVVTE